VNESCLAIIREYLRTELPISSVSASTHQVDIAEVNKSIDVNGFSRK
jgi:hypothetical protein